MTPAPVTTETVCNRDRLEAQVAAPRLPRTQKTACSAVGSVEIGDYSLVSARYPLPTAGGRSSATAETADSKAGIANLSRPRLPCETPLAKATRRWPHGCNRCSRGEPVRAEATRCPPRLAETLK
jgi:hypothetical protein